MDTQSIRHAFTGSQSGVGVERHSLKSLSRRLMLPRANVRTLLEAGELEFQTEFATGTGRNTTWEFAAGHLDQARQDVVDRLIEEIHGEMEGLDVSEQEKVFATLTGLRAHKESVEHEFATKKDDDDDETSPFSKLAGAGVGGVLGAAGGGRFGSLGLVGGAAAGALGGYEIASRPKPRDVAAAGGLGVGAVLAHRAIQKSGGYAAVGGQAADAVEGAIKRTTGVGKRAIAGLGALKKAAGEQGLDLADAWKMLQKAGTIKKGAKAIAKDLL